MPESQQSGQRFPAEYVYETSLLKEKHICQWVLAQDGLGFPPTVQQVTEFASKVLVEPEKSGPLGDSWVQRFVQRNPSITIIQGKLDHVSASELLLNRSRNTSCRESRSVPAYPRGAPAMWSRYLLWQLGS
ncbi:hypothetical protein NM208_g5249 [Fusarium decemcellulare]|uniref:Uncharacterized protein n=1 Tax=Fusarium decemcellulare TaxID=57161 RepID=A0ACC1SHY8_9HYPO|nr:hypothetical protein NM208_g5249 [Fusarium decemcellulare]